MNDQELRAAVLATLKTIAPEVEDGGLVADRPLRNQVDLDSMDWLNFLIGLHERLRVDIPEADYARLVTLNDVSISTQKDGNLVMDATARTFRYLSDDEAAAQRKSKPAPKNMPNWASEEIAPATVAEIVEMRMSRCLTWASSWAITPRSSRADSNCRMPVVAATAACSGLRPVAKALGEAVGMTYSAGMGRPARWVRRSTTW